MGKVSLEDRLRTLRGAEASSMVQLQRPLLQHTQKRERQHCEVDLQTR